MKARGVCVCVCVCPELTDERFASIFEQSALASLSVEATLFLRDGEAQQKYIASVTPGANEVIVISFRAAGVSAVRLARGQGGRNSEVILNNGMKPGVCPATTSSLILLQFEQDARLSRPRRHTSTRQRSQILHTAPVCFQLV